MILYLAADLLWGTRIRSTAESLGIPARPARNLDMLTARLADSDVRGFVVDLEGGEAAIALIGHLRRADATPKERGVRVVAWAPHVDVEGLRRAKEAGADAVMARGAFARGLVRILTELERGSSVQDELEE
jgi:hypothetical protein